MPIAEKQASVLPSPAKNVTAIPSMDKKHTTIPSNGFSVQYEEIWHDGQKLRPGVWLHSTWDSKLGEQSTHEWICGPLEVEAITRSLQSTDYGRLISFINLDGQERKWAMPNLLLAGKSDSILGTLLTMGLDVSYEHRTKITAFIAGQRPTARVIAATETGWHGDKLFIMPRQNIGEGQAVYQSEDATQDDYRVGGTLHGWQSSIGSMCAGNPLLLLSICTSLAGPILFHVQMKGGGFHLVGDSSTGKTIATIAGASVWGHGEKFLRTWLATGNGLEGIANERNDTILALDEIGEADAREVGAVVYALANGDRKDASHPQRISQKDEALADHAVLYRRTGTWCLYGRRRSTHPCRTGDSAVGYFRLPHSWRMGQPAWNGRRQTIFGCHQEGQHDPLWPRRPGVCSQAH